jgi:hypothetical protein
VRNAGNVPSFYANFYRADRGTCLYWSGSGQHIEHWANSISKPAHPREILMIEKLTADQSLGIAGFSLGVMTIIILLAIR